MPVTLKELVQTGVDCQAAGAAVIHVHIRDDDAQATLDPKRLHDTVAALRESTDLIVQLSTGGAVSDGEAARLAVLDAAPDMASCTMGTVNFGDDIFMNRWASSSIFTKRCVRHESSPSTRSSISDTWRAWSVSCRNTAYRSGSTCTSTSSSCSRWSSRDAATVTAMAEAARRHLPEGSTFAATGIGRTTLPVMFASLASGGHVRVGMEDTVSFARRQPVESNAQLVQRAAEVAGLAQRPPMEIGEARRMLGIREPG